MWFVVKVYLWTHSSYTQDKKKPFSMRKKIVELMLPFHSHVACSAHPHKIEFCLYLYSMCECTNCFWWRVCLGKCYCNGNGIERCLVVRLINRNYTQANFSICTLFGYSGAHSTRTGDGKQKSWKIHKICKRFSRSLIEIDGEVKGVNKTFNK